MNKSRPRHREAVFNSIDLERDYQALKYKEQERTLPQWVMILQKELGEAAIEAGFGSDADALRELLQVAAVAVACLEQHGVVPTANHLDKLVVARHASKSLERRD